jgi:PAS domain S-box-containing protein
VPRQGSGTNCNVLILTLASIGDGVISTDCEGRITFVNRVACELTGWTQSDAVGQLIENVFAVRDEETDVAVESPTTRAMRERRIVSLNSRRRMPSS